jgi:MFS family permease
MNAASARATKESPAVSQRPQPPGARFAIVILTSMNLLNYMDRYVPSAVKSLFKGELHFTDRQTSYPLSAFLIVYLFASPIFGSLGERYSRKVLISAGVALWSLATAGAAYATGFWSFLIPRAAVGVGEAAYATISPAIISDYYPAARRNRILTIFYVAIPVGAAIGFVAGGFLGEHYGWRTAFLACGLPGLATAALVLLMKEPPRGYYDAKAMAASVPSWGDALAALSRNRQFVLCVAGYTAVTFASGAFADWFPTFLTRYRGFSVESAASVAGMTSATGGLIGTALGGLAGDWLRRRTRQPYLAVSAWSMAGTTAFVLVALRATDHTLIIASMLAAQIMLWCYNGPINALIVNAVAADMRTRAVSVSIFCIHLFGDASAPTIVGAVSDATQSLQYAIGLVPVALVVGTLIWMYGWRTVPDQPEAV